MGRRARLLPAARKPYTPARHFPTGKNDPDFRTKLQIAVELADCTYGDQDTVRATLPGKATWYLATDLPRPGGPREHDSPHPPADLAEIVRIYGIRHWIEQSYKQVKDELGWADFQVRSDTAIRRHHSQPGSRRLRSPRRTPGERGGTDQSTTDQSTTDRLGTRPCRPRALRRVRSWLTPAITLTRWWRAWSPAPPPDQLQALIDTVSTGHGLHRYLPP